MNHSQRAEANMKITLTYAQCEALDICTHPYTVFTYEGFDYEIVSSYGDIVVAREILVDVVYV